MKYFITGITGFIGTHLYKKLLEDGHQVIAQVRNKRRAAELTAEGVDVVFGDLSIFKNTRLVLPEVDCVVHLAGVIAAKTLEQYDEINYGSVVDLVDCIHRQNWVLKKFIFASSLAAAGPNVDGQPHYESSLCNPVDQYGIAKLRAETYLKQNAKFPTTSFRPALVLGPGDSATLTLYKMALTGFGFKAAGFDQKLSVLDVDDLVSAIQAMCLEINSTHQTYFVSSAQPIATSAFFNKIAQSVGKRRVFVVSVPISILWCTSRLMIFLSKLFKFTNQLDDKQYKLITAPAFICDASLLQQRTKWKPMISLEQSLAKAVTGYRETGEL